MKSRDLRFTYQKLVIPVAKRLLDEPHPQGEVTKSQTPNLRAPRWNLDSSFAL